MRTQSSLSLRTVVLGTVLVLLLLLLLLAAAALMLAVPGRLAVSVDLVGIKCSSRCFDSHRPAVSHFGLALFNGVRYFVGVVTFTHRVPELIGITIDHKAN
jgi:hypothetical protein